MPRPVPDLREYKTAAKRLLAALQSDDPSVASTAAERFSAALADRSAPEILAGRDRMQLKHALAAIACEHRYTDWKALKDAADVVWYPRSGGAFLNAWYARYEDARAHLDGHGGYLLTHRGDYFVCGEDFIRARGLDPADPRWTAIGHDVAKPRDQRACAELRALAEAESRKPAPASTCAADQSRQ